MGAVLAVGEFGSGSGVMGFDLFGDHVRVVLSNAFGTAPFVVGAANVALRDKEAAILSKSSRALRFSGSASTTIHTRIERPPAGTAPFVP